MNPLTKTFAASGSSAAITWPGGVGSLLAQGSAGAFGGGTLTVEVSLDGSTWTALGGATTLTANGAANFTFMACSLRVTLTGATSPALSVKINQAMALVLSAPAPAAPAETLSLQAWERCAVVLKVPGVADGTEVRYRILEGPNGSDSRLEPWVLAAKVEHGEALLNLPQGSQCVLIRLGTGEPVDIGPLPVAPSAIVALE